MGIFISVQITIECVAVAVLFACAFSATYVRILGILQSFGYSGAKLFGWAGKKNNALVLRETLLFMLCALSYAVVALCFSFAGRWAAVAALAAYALFFILYAAADKKKAVRSPAVFTPRLKRLYVVLFFITAVVAYLCVTLLNFADCLCGNTVFEILRYLPLSAFPLLSLPLAALANLAAKLYETPHNNSLIRRARAKLAQRGEGLTVVGITGSYGKTSVKHILAALLSKKYRVLSTPRSHNTPLGLALTLNNNNLGDYDVLIAEMGARHVGDIAELCKICPPDYALITGVCPQHLESFGTVENIISAKGEILSAVKNCAFIAPACFEDFARFPCQKEAAACASDVECTQNGTDFTLTLGGERRRVHTKLLGEHSAGNIALAARLAFELGLSLDDIAAAVGELGFVEHRLQLIESGGIYILDDGYNSNVRGAEEALKVLRMFGGKKTVVTPGLVELGVLEESENYRLGKELVGLDRVILVGDTLITPVKEGYLKNGGNPALLQTAPSLPAAEELLKGLLQSGDCVLFLNDLPDIY